jgi:hypothetical protein
MQREIAKLPNVPPLNEAAIQALTELCFRTDDDLSHKTSDTIFVFGTVSLEKAGEAVTEAVKQVSPKKLVLSGGMPTYPDSNQTPKAESELLYEKIQKFLPTGLEVHLEKASNNSPENVQFSLPFLQDSQCITFITKSVGAGRHYLTLKKFLPAVPLFQKTFDARYPENSTYITKTDWYKNSHALQRVWGEFLRIAKYGSRGDIAYDEIKNLIDVIVMNTQEGAS